MQTAIKKMIHVANQCRWICWVVLAVSMMADSNDVFSAQRGPGEQEQIERLVGKLNSRKFATRESAAEDLVAAGAEALRPLAVNVLGNDPETTWRTREVIERIGTRGDESVFYQALAILQVLQLDDGRRLDGRFAELEREWKIERKKSTIRKLRRLGATIADPWEDRLGPSPNDSTVIINQIILNDRLGQPMITGEGPKNRTSDKPPTKKIPSAQLDLESTTKRIDRILSDSLEANRELVFGKEETESEGVVAASNVVDSVEVFRLQRNQAFLRRPSLRPAENTNGITVRLSDKWQGTLEQVQMIKTLPGLACVELDEFTPGRQQLNELSKLKGVGEIRVIGEQIPDDDLPILASAPALTTVQFKKRAVTGPAIAHVTQAKKLRTLRFQDCTMDNDALAQLEKSRSIRSVYFADMQIDDSIFGCLRKIPQLNFVDLSVCKFKTSAYRKFTIARPNIQIVFTPQAFLGVRGPANFAENAGCQISEVIPNSGAAVGGLKIGDVIRTVNGQRIRRFEDLRLHIAQHKVGETLKLEVDRDGEPVDLQIVLGQYDANLR
jgi:hypothetical protein